jgi:aspartyl/glutamyl-tRNA(Asn/Gln) amidotransferase C subunit
MKKADIDIKALATLARLAVPEEELARLEREIPNILSFVETIQEVNADAGEHEATVRNVMREDEHPHERGMYTERLLEAAPASVGKRIAVKQVISRSKR